MSARKGKNFRTRSFPTVYPCNITASTARIANELTSDNMEVMVERFYEIPLFNQQEKIAVAAKIVFQKAIEDIHSSSKFVTFINLVCENQNHDTGRMLREQITDLFFQHLQYRAGKGDDNRRGKIGGVQLLGELFVSQPCMYDQGVLECVEMMMSSRVDDNLQNLCQLLTIVGKQLDHQISFISARVKLIQFGARFPMPTYVPYPEWMETQFHVLKKYAENTSLSNVTRQKLQDLIRMKESGWTNLGCGIKPNEFNPPPMSKSLQDAFLSSSLRTSTSQESVTSNLSLESPRQPTVIEGFSSIPEPVTMSATTKLSPGSRKSLCQIRSELRSKVKPDLSTLKPEDAMVEILKTLNAGNVPAVTLKITNLPFANDFERIYAMVRNILDKSERGPSFPPDLQTPAINGPANPDTIISTVCNNDRASLQKYHKETQTRPKFTVDAQVATDTNFPISTVDKGVPDETDITHRSSLYANSVDYQIQIGVPNFVNAVEASDIKPEADWQKVVGSQLTPHSIAPPALKYLSMYSNYDRMLEKLCEEDAEELNMEICSLIFQRLKLRKGKLDGR